MNIADNANKFNGEIPHMMAVPVVNATEFDGLIDAMVANLAITASAIARISGIE